MWLLMLENVIHPETREVLMQEGTLYDVDGFNQLSVEYGIDNIKCVLCATIDAAYAVQAAWLNGER